MKKAIIGVSVAALVAGLSYLAYTVYEASKSADEDFEDLFSEDDLAKDDAN